MRMSNVNPNARFILLSATMDNGVQIAKWLKHLNGKKTYVIQSDWRPTEITPRFHTHEEDGSYAQVDRKNKKDKWKQGKTISDVNRIEETIRVLKSEHYEGCKTIIFVHSKNYGKALGRAIIDSGIRCGFHNASVDQKIRHKMETAFNDPYSGYDVLVATSTLSVGVNVGV